MDLDLTDEQRMLQQTVREVCARYSAPETVRALEDTEPGYSTDLWRELANLDLLGLSLPEEHGGAGQTAIETALVHEEFGRALVASPHLVSCVIAASLLQATGHTELLARIVSGEEIVTVAWLEPGRGFGPEGIRAVADGGSITGTKHLVAFASSATRFLVLARDGDAIGLYLVDPSDARVVPQRTSAREPHGRVTFDGARAETLLADTWDAWLDASTDAQIALAAYAIGAAERAHELAVEYAKERVQFDRPIGSFQAVAHPLADTKTEIEGGRVLVWQAAWARARGLPARVPAAMAKYWAADVCKRTTRLGHQIFGGIGFTESIDMQLYYRRAKQIETLWWDAPYLEEVIAGAELDAATPYVGVDAGLET